MEGLSDAKNSKKFIDDHQIIAIQNELEIIKSLNCPILSNLGSFEIDRLRGGIADYIDLVTNKKVKVRTKIDIPVDQYPATNFVGKLLGPGASTLKSIQEQTNTKMTIRGIDNQKQKPSIIPDHCEKLHLQIDSLGTPAEAFYKLSHAVAEVQKCLTYNLPVGFPSIEQTVANSGTMGNDYNMNPRGFPSPIRGGISRGGNRRGGRGGARFVPPLPTITSDPNTTTWVKDDEPNGGQDYNFGGPVFNERNPINRVAPY